MDVPKTHASIKREFRLKMREVDPQDQTAVDLVWLWYAMELYEFDEDPLLFQLCEKESKGRARDLVFQFIREEITERQFYDGLSSNLQYAANLKTLGLTDKDFTLEDPDFLEIVDVAALECVAAFRPFVGMVIDPENWDCLPIIEAGIPTWYRYVTKLHKFLKIKELKDFRKVLRDLGKRDREILNSENYNSGKLSKEELDQLRIDLGLVSTKAEMSDGPLY